MGLDILGLKAVFGECVIQALPDWPAMTDGWAFLEKNGNRRIAGSL